MLQRLLEDRFKLVVHQESRELATYNLVKQPSDGKLGERLKASDVDCAALRAAGRSPAPVPDGQLRPCVMLFGQGLLRANGMRIADLVEMGSSRAAKQ